MTSAQPLHPQAPSDLAQRSEALNVRDSYLVTAPAGSGKTELLTQRYLALLAVVNEPEEILAVTFTLKATAEMKARIVEALLRGQDSTPPESEHERQTWSLAREAVARDEACGWNLVLNPSRLNIKTIDSFCSSLARRAPLVGLMGGSVGIADDTLALYSQAARAVLQSLESDAGHAAQVADLLSHVDNRFDAAEELMIEMLAKRDQWLPVVLASRGAEDLRQSLELSLKTIRHEVLGGIRGALMSHEGMIIDCATKAVTNLAPDSKYRGLQHLANEKALPALIGGEPEAWESLRSWVLTEQGAVRAAGSAATGHPAPSKAKEADTKERLKEAKDQFKSLLNDLRDDTAAVEALQRMQTVPPSAYSDEEWSILEALLALLPVLASELYVAFQKVGEVDHVEISAAARRVLGEEEAPSDLALVLDAQLSHVLFDEFQDTNYLQMELLSSITREWAPGDGKTMFLVGDPMQSIYAFRGSNVGLFVDASRSGIGHYAIKTLNLAENFRSTANIVDWVNEAFRPVFPTIENANLGAIPYRDSVPFNAAAENSGVQVLGFDVDRGGRRAEADWIASRAGTLLVDASDETVAVLVRTRTHLSEIVAAFRRHEVSYQAVDIDPLADLLEIRDLASLTRAICQPDDATAWLSVLRSPMIGLDRAALSIVAGVDSYGTVWDKIRNPTIRERLGKASPDALSRLDSLNLVMSKTIGYRERKSLADLVWGAWLSLNGPSTLESAGQIDNARAFIAVLRRFTIAEFSLSRLDNALAKLFAKPATRRGKAVQLMTMHKSKGLQFDHVFVPELSREPRTDRNGLLLWDRYTEQSGQEHLILSARPAVGSDTPALVNFVKSQASDRSRYESARLLYVACTRAKKNLYLSGSLTLKDDTVRTPSSRTLLSLIWESVQNKLVISDHEAPEQEQLEGVLAHDTLSRLATVEPVRSTDDDTPLAKYRGMIQFNETTPTYTWEAKHGAAIGTTAHRILERISVDGLDLWSSARVEAQKDDWRLQLERQGVPSFMSGQATKRLAKLIVNALESDAGRWILGQHDESASELRVVSKGDNGDFDTHIIDRTFKSGDQRYVVDYKSEQPLEGEVAADFDARLAKSHKDKMATYAEKCNALYGEDVTPLLFSLATSNLVGMDGQRLNVPR